MEDKFWVVEIIILWEETKQQFGKVEPDLQLLYMHLTF